MYLSAVLSAGRAIAHVPALAALAALVIALLAGPALIARKWKPQLKHWQDLRKTE